MEYILTITEQDIQVLSAALGELPFKHSAQLIQKLQSQLSSQQQTQKDKEEK